MSDTTHPNRQIRLVVEYDGTSYAGWQRQENEITVQQVLEEVMERIVGHPVRLFSSGRTDAGVHARGMVATFRTPVNHPLSAFTHGANALLPPDIAVQSADEVPLSFDPRRDAVAKQYRYTLHAAPFRSPLARWRSWHLPRIPDLHLMEQAARSFVGTHDFTSYRTTGSGARSTIREIFSCTIEIDPPFVHIDVVGSGFLRNMVRIMAGTIVEIGLGKLPPDQVERTFAAPGLRAGQTAPPQGLCLQRVWYDEGFRELVATADRR